MSSNFKNGEEYYNKIYLLFNLFIAVSLLPFGYLLLQRQAGELYELVEGTLYWLVVVSLLLATAAIIFKANQQFSAFINETKENLTFRRKLEDYKDQSLYKYGLFLLANLICVCGLFLTTNAIFIVGYIVSVILLSIKRPTLNILIEDLKLNEEEQQILIEKKDIPFD